MSPIDTQKADKRKRAGSRTSSSTKRSPLIALASYYNTLNAQRLLGLFCLFFLIIGATLKTKTLHEIKVLAAGMGIGFLGCIVTRQPSPKTKKGTTRK